MIGVGERLGLHPPEVTDEATKALFVQVVEVLHDVAVAPHTAIAVEHLGPAIRRFLTGDPHVGEERDVRLDPLEVDGLHAGLR